MQIKLLVENHKYKTKDKYANKFDKANNNQEKQDKFKHIDDIL